MAIAWDKHGTLPSEYKKQKAEEMKNIKEIIDTMNSRKNSNSITQAQVAKMLRGQ